MITLEEAIKLAEKWRGHKIRTIKDCGDRWLFTFEDDYPKNASVAPDWLAGLITTPDIIPTFMFKNDGHFESFYIGNQLDFLAKTPTDTHGAELR